MTGTIVLLIIVALMAIGYVYSGYKAYRAERDEEAREDAMQVVTPYYALIRLGRGHFIRLTLFDYAHVTFPVEPSNLFEWERRAIDRARRWSR